MDLQDTTADRPEQLNVLSRLIDEWRQRVQMARIMRGTPIYMALHTEFWIGAGLAAEFLDRPLPIAVGVYLFTKRDMLDFEQAEVGGPDALDRNTDAPTG